MAEVITEYVGQYKGDDSFSTRWWTASEKEQFKHVFGTVSMLEKRQNYRTLANIRHARLYANLEVLGVYAGIYVAPVNDYVLPNRLSLNVIKSCIDTASARIAKSKTRPLFLTDGGDFELQNKAKSLTKFLDGAWDDIGLYEEKQKTFVDSCVFGTGALKFYKDTRAEKVCCERVIIEELLVDDADGLYQKPSVLFQRRLVSKDVLMDLFPDKKEQINSASNGIAHNYNSDMVKNLVKVIEAWHLPSVHGATDGRHVIAIDNCTLVSEPWTFDFFPFVFERWTPRLLGFFGMGIAEELVSVQMDINRTLRDIQESMRLFAVPRVYVRNDSQINIQGINNDIASIVKYSGTEAPVFFTPQAMAADVYQHLWNLYNKAFEIVGVSQMSATASKPAGLNSGIALREFQDATSERFSLVESRRERTFLDAAKIYLELMKDMAKDYDIKVKIATSGAMQTMRFKDVNLSEEKYLLRAFPSSILPTQPAAKLQKVVELMQLGVVDKETGFSLLDFPDLEGATNRILGPEKITLKMLDKMVETEVYEAPEPYMDLATAVRMAQGYYLDAKTRELPEEKLELIRRFIDDASSLLIQAEQGAQPEAVDPQLMALEAQQVADAQAETPNIARGQRMPESDLLPFRP